MTKLTTSLLALGLMVLPLTWVSAKGGNSTKNGDTATEDNNPRASTRQPVKVLPKVQAPDDKEKLKDPLTTHRLDVSKNNPKLKADNLPASNTGPNRRNSTIPLASGRAKAVDDDKDKPDDKPVIKTPRVFPNKPVTGPKVIVPKDPTTPTLKPVKPIKPIGPGVNKDPIVTPKDPVGPIVKPIRPGDPRLPADPKLPKHPVGPVVTPKDPIGPVVTPKHPVGPVVTPKDPVGPIVKPIRPGDPRLPADPKLPRNPVGPVVKPIKPPHPGIDPGYGVKTPLTPPMNPGTAVNPPNKATPNNTVNNNTVNNRTTNNRTVNNTTVNKKFVNTTVINKTVVNEKRVNRTYVDDTRTRGRDAYVRGDSGHYREYDRHDYHPRRSFDLSFGFSSFGGGGDAFSFGMGYAQGGHGHSNFGFGFNYMSGGYMPVCAPRPVYVMPAPMLVAAPVVYTPVPVMVVEAPPPTPVVMVDPMVYYPVWYRPAVMVVQPVAMAVPVAPMPVMVAPDAFATYPVWYRPPTMPVAAMAVAQPVPAPAYNQTVIEGGIQIQ